LGQGAADTLVKEDEHQSNPDAFFGELVASWKRTRLGPVGTLIIPAESSIYLEGLSDRPL
jgi:hypothetical protein